MHAYMRVCVYIERRIIQEDPTLREVWVGSRRKKVGPKIAARHKGSQGNVEPSSRCSQEISGLLAP